MGGNAAKAVGMLSYLMDSEEFVFQTDVGFTLGGLFNLVSPDLGQMDLWLWCLSGLVGQNLLRVLQSFSVLCHSSSSENQK